MTLNEEKNEMKKISVDELLCLLEIGDKYENFREDLYELVGPDIIQMHKVIIANGYMTLNRKYKDFINKYNDIIQIMKRYGTYSMMNTNCMEYDYFYKYIFAENKENIDIIKNVVAKLKEMNFSNIILRKNFDFRENEYQLNDYNTIFEQRVKFLENIETIPSYYNKPIKYRTNNSCYCMSLNYYKDKFKDKEYISQSYRDIELNSLVFDINRLPKEISIDTIIKPIKDAANLKSEEYKDIKNLVDLSILIEEIKSRVEALEEIVNDVNIKEKEFMINSLKDMSYRLFLLNDYRTKYLEQVNSNYKNITEDFISKQKVKVLENRFADYD